MSEIFKVFLESKSVIKGVLSRYVRQPEAIEDLAQETFLRAFAAEMTSDIREPKAFLIRVARNLAIGEVKKHVNAKTDSLEDSGGSDVLLDREQAPADEQIDAKRKYALFCEAVASLPSEFQEPFILRKMENLKFKQIATRLNITVNAAEKRVARGLVLCEAYLQKRGYDMSIYTGKSRSGAVRGEKKQPAGVAMLQSSSARERSDISHSEKE